MLTDRNQSQKILSNIDLGNVCNLYGVKSEKYQIIVYSTNQKLQTIPHGLTHLISLDKQNFKSNPLQILPTHQINKLILNYFIITIGIPYNFYNYTYTLKGFNLENQFITNKQTIKLIQTIKNNHLQFINSSKFLFQERYQQIIQPISYLIQPLFIPTNIDSSSFSDSSDNQPNHISLLISNLNEQSSDIADSLLRLIQCQTKHKSNLMITQRPMKIWNPHSMCRIMIKPKHLIYTIKGIYEYYHYGSQNFHDLGWGCAYRALQTLLSWLKLQHYVELKVPSIIEIQSILDTIDTNKRLKGTNQWIGVTEATWVINKLVGIDCRILHVKDGNGIMEHCEQLKNHFQKVGSPIMYGGGQYAYSVVGINYSWQLGSCQFLILDPHYPYNDNLETIVDKKGVTWKKAQQMFKKGVFYNFCLPIL